MTLKTTQLPLTLLLGLSLLAACSGDDGDSKGSGGGGGTTSTSGGNKATGGKAGSSSAGTSTGGKASGGTNNGGTNSGGFSFGGSGGFNPDDYMCDPVPENGSDCDAGAQPCLNGMELCTCLMGQWACIDFGQGAGGGGGGGFGQIDCPATQPMNDTPCGDAFGFCPYGGPNMGCVCLAGNWACN